MSAKKTSKKATQWWQQTNQELAGQKMRERLRRARASGQKRRELFRELAKGYGVNLQDATTPQQPSHVLSFNYARSYLDTWVSQLCKSRVLPQVITTGGDYDARKQAEGMNLLFEATFERCGVFDLDPQWTRDSGMFGTGIAYVCEEFAAPCVERVLPSELDFDAYEWRMGKGRTLFRSRPYDRYQLIETYPDYEAEILGAPSAKLEDDTDVQSPDHDLVMVGMGWHLPSSPDADDGRFCVTIEGCCLEYEPYEYDSFPFAFFPRVLPVIGMMGDSIMSEMLPGQRELDRLTDRTSDAIDSVGVPRIFVPPGWSGKAKLLKGVNAGVFEVPDPSKVVCVNFEPISPTVGVHQENVIQKMSAVSTVSPMAAMGEKPTGITAASALQLLDDQESERKLIPQRNREQFYVQIARLLKRVCSQLKKYTVLAKNGGQAISVTPGKVMLDDAKLIYTVMPTSYLAKTPAARTQQAQDLLALNPNLPPSQIFKALDIPDLVQYTALESAVYDWICKTCEAILEGKTKDDEGEPIAVDPYMVLLDKGKTAVQTVAKYVAKASCDGVPGDRIDRLRQFGVACQKEADKSAQAPPPPPGVTPPMTGAPMPPPEGMPPAGMPPMPPNMPPPQQGMPS